jgi:hypothetical protein
MRRTSSSSELRRKSPPKYK